MKVSEALFLKESLLRESANVENSIQNNIQHLDSIRHTFPNESNYLTRLITQWQEILSQTKDITDSIDHRIKKLDQLVADASSKYLVSSYHMHDIEKGKFIGPKFQRKFRILPITTKTKTLVRTRIGSYVDWRYPGLEIGPGDGVWTENLVGFDPLYIVDINEEFLFSTKEKFNTQYQHRLRIYKTEDTNLNMLPTNQIGFAFSWNVFNYFPIEVINSYLIEIFKVLREGGVFMFSYNNAERPDSMVRVEDVFMCYTPKAMLVSLVESLGYKVLKIFDEDSMLSWIEIQKPGKLHSIKASQTLGRIIQPTKLTKPK